MLKYILKRIFYIFLVFLVLSFLIFAIYTLIPGNIAALKTREDVNSNKSIPEDQREAYREERYQYYLKYYGLDGNIFQRYGRWMGFYYYEREDANGNTIKVYDGVLQGELGTSTQYNKPVKEIIIEPMKNTIFINIFATILALGITIPLGIFCARKRGSKLDIGVQVGTIIGYSLPTFIIAILFIWFFAIVLKLFPVSGSVTTGAGYEPGTWKYFVDRLYHICLPLIVMTFSSLGGMTRYVRASMIESLSMDCIKTARAKGVKERVVIYSHAWRNALIPIITLVIGWFLGIFSGSIMIENIFGLNGIGKEYYSALNNRDNSVILTLQLFYVLIGLFGNLIIDICYGLVDPRIRVNK